MEQSTFGAARAMTRSEQVRSQRTAMFEKARTALDKKTNTMAALKNSQDNAKSAKALGGLLSMFKSRNVLDDVRMRRENKVSEFRHTKQIKSLDSIERAIKKLTDVTRFYSGGGAVPAMLPGGRMRYRDPRTGRFVSGAAARRAGMMGTVGRFGLAGAGLALAGVGGYYSTKGILNNRGKGFFQGGLNSRAAGYAGNIGSGALAGAAIGSVVPVVGTAVGAVIGAGVGLVGSIYADFHKEINAWVMKKIGGAKKLAGELQNRLTAGWNGVLNFFDSMRKGAVDIFNKLPGSEFIKGWFSMNVNFATSAWNTVTGFFTNVSGIVDEHLTNTFPAYSAMKAWGETTVGPWVEKTWTGFKRGLSDFVSSAWSWAIEHSPISFSEGQGLTRKLMNEKTSSASKQSMMAGADLTSLYQTRSYATKKADEYAKQAEQALAKGKTGDYQKFLNKSQSYRQAAGMAETELSGRFNMGISPRPDVAASGASMVGGSYLPKAMQLAGGQTAGAPELARARKYSGAAGLSASRLEAARVTGADYGFLMALAAKESSFNATAQAKTSSAFGADQFTSGTWNSLVDEVGYKYGIQKETVIGKDANGKNIYSTTARSNATSSGIMAGLLANKNAAKLQKILGRPPYPNELYIFHFFGDSNGTKFLRNWQNNPGAPAARDFGGNKPKTVAGSNMGIFFQSDGVTEKTYQQVYDTLSVGFTTGDVLAFTQLYGGEAAAQMGGPAPAMPSTVASNTDKDRSAYAQSYRQAALSKLAAGQKAGVIGAGEAANIQAAIDRASGKIASGQVTKEQLSTLSVGGITRNIGGLASAVQGDNIQTTSADFVSPSAQAQIMASAKRVETRSEQKQPSMAPTQETPAAAFTPPESISFTQMTDAGLVVLNVPGA